MSGLNRLNRRMQYYGGDTDTRINKSKLRSMLSAQKNSYQAENITFNNKQWRCLINPSKLTEDYDRKSISIVYDAGMEEGDTFYWNRTGKWWMASQQQHTEEAYFRAQIDVCNYQIDIDGTDYWIYLRGPEETALDWTSKHNIHVNNLNYTLAITIKKNEQTKAFFNRFKIVKIDNHNWQVVATDKYSQDGVIQVYLDEYSDNEMEDNKAIPQEIVYDKKSSYIDGKTTVAPFDIVTYEIKNVDTFGEWSISDDKVAKIIDISNNFCTIEIISSKTADFTLTYKIDDDNIIENEITVSSF
jgi:hypothetical protein